MPAAARPHPPKVRLRAGVRWPAREASLLFAPNRAVRVAVVLVAMAAAATFAVWLAGWADSLSDGWWGSQPTGRGLVPTMAAVGGALVALLACLLRLRRRPADALEPGWLLACDGLGVWSCRPSGHWWSDDPRADQAVAAPLAPSLASTAFAAPAQCAAPRITIDADRWMLLRVSPQPGVSADHAQDLPRWLVVRAADADADADAVERTWRLLRALLRDRRSRHDPGDAVDPDPVGNQSLTAPSDDSDPRPGAAPCAGSAAR